MRVNVKNLGLTFTWSVVLLIVIDALLVWPYAYRLGYGHGDVQTMEFALFFWQKNGGPLPHFAYGRDFSFGWYYWGLGLLRLLKLDPKTFPWVANFSASLASTITSICLLGILVRFFPLTIALLAVILWRFIPEVWELSTYAHPWTIALPFFTAGAWTYTTQIGHNGALNKSWKFYLSCITSTLLMTASLTIRADMIFFMPLLLVLVYFHNKRTVLPLMIIMVSSCILFLFLRHFAVEEIRPSAIDYFERFARFERIPINLMLALYPISGYLLATVIIACFLKFKNKANLLTTAHLIAGFASLAPTLLFWLPIGPPLRHFAPLYITVSVLCAYLLVKGLSLTTFSSASLAVVSLLLSNMLITELGFQILSPVFPPRTVQIGVQRRVMESVTLGIPWLNHAAQQRLNELKERYCVSALSYSDTRPVIFVQDSPYRLCVLAMHRYGSVRRFKDSSGLIVWQLSASEDGPWCVDIPESANKEWLKTLQSFAKRHKRELRFLSTRIPKTLVSVLKEQMDYIQSAEKGTTQLLSIQDSVGLE